MLPGVAFVSAVRPDGAFGREGLFRRSLLARTLADLSILVDTCCEVETPSDPGGRLIGQRRNGERPVAVCGVYVRVDVPRSLARVAVTKKNRPVRSGDLPCPFRSQ